MNIANKRSLKVFLCHAHADRDSVRGLYTRLTKDGVDAWLDKAKLLPGQDWELEIRKAVLEADVVVVCLSKQFNQAGFRQKEVRWALDTAMEKPEGDIFIIPARLEECDNLESLRKWHWVNLFEEDGYQNLIRALRRRAEVIGVEINVDGNKKVDQSNSVETKKIKLRRQLEIVLMLVGIIVVIAIAISYLSPNLLSISISLTPTPTFTASPTRAVLSPVITPNSTAQPTEITDAKGVSMVLVPAGEFTMGSELNDNEKPPHNVYLNSFFIDRYEVTNTDFVKFLNDIRFEISVEAGTFVKYGNDRIYQLVCSDCTNLTDRIKWDGTAYTSISDFEKHPVVFVSWYGANSYCRWRGALLPTEAQWEIAARGTDGRIYPSTIMDKSVANYFSFHAGTIPVGSYESGKSVYDIYDMAGNVWEWVNDWYYQSYYHISPYQNPPGPESGHYHVYRGGGWDSSVLEVSSTNRNSGLATSVFDNVGFRCARAENP